MSVWCLYWEDLAERSRGRRDSGKNSPWSSENSAVVVAELGFINRRGIREYGTGTAIGNGQIWHWLLKFDHFRAGSDEQGGWCEERRKCEAPPYL